MPMPDNILTSLVNVGQIDRPVDIFMQAVDLAPDEVPPWGDANAGIRFQYWPETLTDNRPSEWNGKGVPGGSHPIYQWAKGGERSISFTAIFTTDTKPRDGLLTVGDVYSSQDRSPVSGIQPGVRDVDIRMAINWLRWFTYPTYGLQDYRAYEPAKCLIVIPNSGIGYNGSDWVLCVMAQCDVTYEEFFPSGFPRIAEVQLEFRETVQRGSRVQFHDRREMNTSAYITNYLSVRQDQTVRLT